jgi:phenylpyruvate tautomerase PptA (4-oxalocrotonate tautomerase family)
MPHVIVKMYPGRSEQQKVDVAAAIVKDVVAITKVGREAVSIAIEEVKPKKLRRSSRPGDEIKSFLADLGAPIVNTGSLQTFYFVATGFAPEISAEVSGTIIGKPTCFASGYVN